MPRPSRTPWFCSRAVTALLAVLFVSCSLVTDFDRDKLPATANERADSGVQVGMDADISTSVDGSTERTDSGVVAEDGSLGADDGALSGDCKSHADCARNRLCCNGACVATTLEGSCTDCEAACSPTAANACNERICGCGSAAACGTERPYCTGNGRNAVCAQCRDATDCAGRPDGRTECMQGNCAACNPSNNDGCSGTTPICNATTFTCEACKATPDNCPGNPVCTPSGACGGCTANDAADCMTPTAPICNLTATPISVCRGCASDTECMTELSRPYCVSNQRCSICNPTNDAGCVATSGTPDCRLNGNGVYQCQACNASSCATGTRCDTNSGKCVQCRNDDDCDSNSAAPFCDATGTCRGCNSSTALGPNAWCTLNTLLTQVSRTVCHTSGRCVRCDATGNAGCSAPTAHCNVPDAAAPQNNMCVECRPGVAADCSAATPICAANGRCRACTAANEAQDCPAASATPACDVASGHCVRCRLNMRGPAAGCAANQVCVMGTNGPECGGCNGHTDCSASPAAPLCNMATHQCVACNLIQTPPDACSSKTAGTICVTGGACAVCDTTNNVGCSAATPLCCASGNAGPSCVPRSATHCASCTNACSGTTPECVSPLNMCGCMGDSCGSGNTCAAGICVPTTGGGGTSSAGASP